MNERCEKDGHGRGSRCCIARMQKARRNDRRSDRSFNDADAFKRIDNNTNGNRESRHGRHHDRHGPVVGVNAGVAGGGASNPFASPITPLPAKLPPDPGGASPLKIVPMKIAFAAGRTADGAAELRSDGSLLLDGTRAGKLSGNKITLKKAPTSLALRSDGFITVASPKGTFFKRDAVGVTSQTGFRLRIGPDNASIVADAPGGGQFPYAQVSIPLLDDATITTALMIASTEAARIPDAAPPAVAQRNQPAPPGMKDGTYSFDFDLSKATMTPRQGQDIPPEPPDPPGN